MSKTFDFLNEDSVKKIREQKLSEGIDNIKSKLPNLDLKIVKESKPVEKPVHTARYSQEQLAELSRKLYRDKINPLVEEEKVEKKDKLVPDTIASRAHTKALSRALIGLRNGGDEGKLAPLAGPNGGNTGTNSNNYYALTTSMTLEEYEEHLKDKFGLEEKKDNPCWTGYKSKKLDTSSYVKEEELKEDHSAVVELEDALLAMEDLSWQSIDMKMREICRKEGITPKELHKEFKTKHGMIPDAWAKEHQMVESVGWFPLDEMTRINQLGKVFDVSFLFRGGTQRLKFFWPEVGYPTREQMQKAVEKFWPAGKLLAYYPSMHSGDNQYNQMVMLPAMSENFELIPDDLWDFMTEEDTEIYDTIAAEEGEPITPVFLSEDEESYFMVISDHDTGEHREVVFGEGNKPGLWANIHAKRKRGEKPAKKGDKDYPKTLDIDETYESKDKYKAPKVPAKKKPFDKIASFSLERPNPMKESYGGQRDGIRDRKYDGYENKLTDDDKKESAKAKSKLDMEKAAKAKKVADARARLDRDIAARKVNEDMSGMSQKSGDKRSTESGAGMTAAGVKKYNSRTGGNLKTAVTTPPSKLKAGSKAAGRRKSFCARSKSWNGERGKAARRRWNC